VAIMVASSLVLAACKSSSAVECTGNGDCDLSSGGVCLTAATGNEWCAYPDPGCPDGYRYSDVNTGDGLSGTCVPADGPPASVLLTVQVGGDSAGSVTSTPAGLTCSASQCTGTFATGTQVQLVATPVSDAAFFGWSGPCTGRNACDITLQADTTVHALFGIPGETIWAQQIGGAGDDNAYRVALTANGLVVAGSYKQSITYDGMNASTTGTDAYIAKLDTATGAPIWFHALGSSNVSSPPGPALAVDTNGDIYIAVSFQGTLVFPTTTLTSAGDYDVALIKYDGDGNFVWARQIGGTMAETAWDLSARDNMVIVTGVFSGTTMIQGGSHTSAGATDGFLAAYTPDGDSLWATTFGGTGGENPRGLAIDGAGSVVVTGYFIGTSSFGPGNSYTTSPANYSDGFIAKYSTANGSFQFARQIGGDHFDGVGAVVIDSNNSIIVAGGFASMVDFGDGNPRNGYSGQAFIAKYSLAGSLQWVQTFGGTDTTETVSINRIALDANDSIAAAGQFCGTVTLGSTALSSVGTCAASDRDAFAAHFAGSNGAPVGAIRAGGTMIDVANGIAVSPDGHYYLAASFQGFAEFGGNAFTSVGGLDSVILDLEPL